jgi:UDP-N-acetylmuramoylalanine--D-glutamate ligase
MHNALNYLAALALGYSAGWSLTAMVKNLAGFTGLSHRCQRITSNDGITWINDSKATNVGATIAAINGLAQTLTTENGVKQQLILIAGGDGKGADFTPLIAPLASHVSHVITLGKDGDKIAQVAQNTNKVNTLDAAVQTAKALANAGDIILLSPACASLDMFKSFGDRGEQFMTAVTQVSGASV